MSKSANQRINESTNLGIRHSLFITHHSSLIIRFAPWLLFAAFLVWGWRGQDFARSIPTYGDILEFTWALSWYSDALRQGLNPLLAPVAFYPAGWDLTTYATGFLFLPALLPLQRLGGAAFAYNIAVLLTFVLAFGGMLALARRSLSPLGATVAALLYTFWGFRWIQTIGHLNILLGSACLPWMIWTLERALDARAIEIARPGRRSLAWLLLTGIIWAITIVGSMYFVWIGGLLLAGWLLGRRLGRQITGRAALISFALPAGVAALLALPSFAAYWRASTLIAAPPPDLVEVNFWGASLNSLPLPYVFHPWLKSFATAIYRGITYEQAAANLGLLAVLMACVGAWAGRNDRRWLPALIITPIALILSLGLTLKWDNQPLQWDGLRPLDAALWQLGHLLKPGVFVTAEPPAPFDAAVPLPGLLLTAVTPLLERARVFARYIFVAALGIYLLAGLGLSRLRWAWPRWLLAAVLIFEVIPPPLERIPFPPPPHEAFAWLKSQPDGAVVDLLAAHPGTLVLINRGETVWATRLHGKPAVGGASSVWPAPAAFLNEWLATHEHAFTGPTVVPLLRLYGARYLLLHMASDWEVEILAEAQQNRELRFVQCFEPPAGPTAWPHPICVLELLPAVGTTVNLAPVDGWSGQEDWGVWAVGEASRSLWVATSRNPHALVLAAFPNCIPGRTQTLAVAVNGVQLADHTWAKCEPWSATLTIPPALARLGGNEVVIRSGYAAQPVDAGGQPASDTRLLSLGFTTLRVEPIP